MNANAKCEGENVAVCNYDGWWVYSNCDYGCDEDGNRIDGDGCSADCQKENYECGNWSIEPGEICDEGECNGKTTVDGCSGKCSTDCLWNDGRWCQFFAPYEELIVTKDGYFEGKETSADIYIANSTGSYYADGSIQAEMYIQVGSGVYHSIASTIHDMLDINKTRFFTVVRSEDVKYLPEDIYKYIWRYKYKNKLYYCTTEGGTPTTTPDFTNARKIWVAESAF